MACFKSSDYNLNFVDNLLSYLNKNISKDVSFEKIVTDLKLKEIKISFDDKPDLVFDLVAEKDWKHNYYLASCLVYLIEEGYIITPKFNHYRITFKGVVKLKTNSFSEVGFASKWGTPREFFLFIIAIISSIVSIVLAVI